MTGHKSIAAVPSAHGLAQSRQTRAFAIDLQQAIVIEREICGVNAIILLLEGAARQLDRAVIEFGQRVRESGRCRSPDAACQRNRGCAGKEVPSRDCDVYSDGIALPCTL
jgi:hypothetical protein